MINNNIIILGAGKSQIHLIEKASQLALNVFAVDQDKNAPGFHLADYNINVSTYDPESIFSELKREFDNIKISGIINSSSGPPVLTKAMLSKTLNLQTYPINIADIIIHKSKMVQYCHEYNISAPKVIIFKEGSKIDPYNISYPVVIKPSLSLIGKSGVYIVNKPEELLSKLNSAIKYSLDGFIDIEEYIEGDDVSFLSFIKKGEIKTQLIVDEINSIDATGLHYGIGYAIPSKYSNTDLENKITNLAKSLIDIFKLSTTTFNFSCRISKNKEPVLIEIHLELGGDLVWDVLIPKSVNVDILSDGIRILSGLNRSSPNYKIKPTAVIYHPGSKLITDRSYDIIQAIDREELEVKLNNSINIYE